MREIKFRLIVRGAVVGYEVHRQSLGHVQVFHSAINDDKEGWEWWNVTYDRGRWIDHLLKDQFTGLKDRDGREIYEGDRCLAISTGVEGYIVFHNGRFCWTDGACHWDVIENNRHDHCPIDTIIECVEDMLVIGTVHEQN